MTPSKPEILRNVRDYIVKEFLYGEAPDSLEDTTPLVSGGILDSISTVKLVAFLEDTYGVRFKPHEMGAGHLETLEMIADLVGAKRAAEGASVP